MAKLVGWHYITPSGYINHISVGGVAGIIYAVIVGVGSNIVVAVNVVIVVLVRAVGGIIISAVVGISIIVAGISAVVTIALAARVVGGLAGYGNRSSVGFAGGIVCRNSSHINYSAAGNGNCSLITNGNGIPGI